MKILALEREMPGSQTEAFQPWLKAEAATIWALHLQDVIRELYFNAEEHTAVLVLECEDLQAARKSWIDYRWLNPV